MLKRAKNAIFGHFMYFGALNRSHITYCDGTQFVLSFGKVARSWRIVQKSDKSISEWSKLPKMRFLAFKLTLVCWINLILYMMIELSIFQHLAPLPGHEESFISFKRAFLNDPKCQKCFFGHYLEFWLLDWLDIAYYW